ncbi:uncharacterized protein HMPREF1541_00983 [Cyphellophora europaea CBS 101466]|uniref:SET domain-containing protein n=1 Tax=Cyphellophora europaea (strain CBS 101466) TaxID=1220924 RepID=W2SFX1_CYPE1|nr:uncharacterized protein HMPREF1541_00983 [Cyphellophora europaea CBS 101466]ETN46794.1 hypothetical protein HMPREF1541_00983 [Cyphellophora europaea CBS 101466]
MKDPKVSSHSENAPNPLEDLEDGNSDSNSVESISDDDGPHILEKFVKPIPKALATRPPQAQAPPTPEQTTNSNISVPIRPSPSSAKTHAPAVPPPSSSQSFSLLVPLSQTKSASEHKARKRALLEELKKSTNVAKTRLPEVEKYFGQTGFSKTFAVDEQERERLLRLAPIKKKKFDPSKLVLDRGNFSNLRISDEEKNERPQHPKEMLKIIYEKRFAEHTGTPLRFRNDINDVRIDGKFQFMSAYVIRDGVRQAPLTTNRGCSCTDTCNPDKCECLIRRIQVLDENHNIIETKTISTYIAHPSDPSITVLHPDYIANELNPTVQHFEITECNEVCSCGPHCPNRVVGRERTLPLEIYMTERCGFGVRCPTKNILKGQFIDVYLGEVITEAEVRKREFIKHPEAPSYVYSLDWFTNTNCYHVDGEYFGSAMRFVNHSCSPNARSFQVQTHRGDKHVYHLALFAIRDIPAGEQITIDYCPQEALAEDVTISGSQEDGDGEGKGKGKAKSVELPGPVVEEEEGRSRCHCGSSNCRTWLWRGPGRKRRKRTVKTS